MLEETLQQYLPVYQGKTVESEAGGSARLRELLVRATDCHAELPALSELIPAALSLASGRRFKAILPLGRTAAEYALIRRADRVAVDYYSTETLPEFIGRGHEISLRKLLDACAEAASCAFRANPESTTGQLMLKLAQRAAGAKISAEPRREPRMVHAAGGALDDPGDSVPLAFGFEAAIAPSTDAFHAARWFADVHALLFEGELWAYSRGKRIALGSGSIMLAVQRMVATVRALVDGWLADRPVNIRIRSEGLVFGVRFKPSDEVRLTLGREGHGALTLTALTVQTAGLPVLRLASDLIRAFVHADRGQSRNLRVAGLRSEVRALRRAIRARETVNGFENRDPERMLLAVPERKQSAEIAAPTHRTQPGRLRFFERWGAQIDGLDAASSFLCGDRLVVATPKRTLALDRERGELLWSKPTAHATYFLAVKTLLRLMANGEVELCDLQEGQVYARCRISPRTGGPALAVSAGGENLPPVAILAEGRQRLVAIDLRTGEPRWRYKAQDGGLFQLRRVGRVLLVASGACSVDAVEIASGELIWRFAERDRFFMAPAVCRDVVVAACGERGGATGALYGIELCSGRLLWRQPLEAAAVGCPIDTGVGVAVPISGPRHGILSCFDPVSGEALWSRPDPGLGSDGTAISVDSSLIVNTPSGRVSALDTENGATRWSRALSDPVNDDVPRQLEPVLRHGAMFVPAARVHVLRPQDGVSLAADMPCDLVPDWLRVDERGWLYVAEESGHLRAYAPAAHLSVVR